MYDKDIFREMKDDHRKIFGDRDPAFKDFDRKFRRQSLYIKNICGIVAGLTVLNFTLPVLGLNLKTGSFAVTGKLISFGPSGRFFPSYEGRLVTGHLVGNIESGVTNGEIISAPKENSALIEEFNKIMSETTGDCTQVTVQYDRYLMTDWYRHESPNIVTSVRTKNISGCEPVVQGHDLK